MSSNNEEFYDFLGFGALTLLVASAYYVYKKANSEAEIDEAIAERIRNSESIKMLEEGPSISTSGINLGKKAYSFDKREYDELQKKIESIRRGVQTTAPLSDDVVSL